MGLYTDAFRDTIAPGPLAGPGLVAPVPVPDGWPDATGVPVATYAAYTDDDDDDTRFQEIEITQAPGENSTLSACGVYRAPWNGTYLEANITTGLRRVFGDPSLERTASGGAFVVLGATTDDVNTTLGLILMTEAVTQPADAEHYPGLRIVRPVAIQRTAAGEVRTVGPASRGLAYCTAVTDSGSPDGLTVELNSDSDISPPTSFLVEQAVYAAGGRVLVGGWSSGSSAGPAVYNQSIRLAERFATEPDPVTVRRLRITQRDDTLRAAGPQTSLTGGLRVAGVGYR